MCWMGKGEIPLNCPSNPEIAPSFTQFCSSILHFRANFPQSHPQIHHCVLMAKGKKDYLAKFPPKNELENVLKKCCAYNLDLSFLALCRLHFPSLHCTPITSKKPLPCFHRHSHRRIFCVCCDGRPSCFLPSTKPAKCHKGAIN